jgi:hypothetical protein
MPNTSQPGALTLCLPARLLKRRTSRNGPDGNRGDIIRLLVDGIRFAIAEDQHELFAECPCSHRHSGQPPLNIERPSSLNDTPSSASSNPAGTHQLVLAHLTLIVAAYALKPAA